MDYRDLEVWQRAHSLAIQVYRLTRAWPKEELYGLTSQVRRAAVSISANIAEGQSRRGSAEFARFVSMAAGSAAELDAELMIARDLEYLTPDAHAKLEENLAVIRRQLTTLGSRLSSSVQRPASGAKR